MPDHHDVSGLDVAMDQPHRLRGDQALETLHGDLAEILVCQRPPDDHLLERLSAQQFRDDECPARVPPDIIHCENVRVLEGRKHLGLLEQVIRRCSLDRLHPLHRDLTLQLGVGRDENLAQSAMADSFFYLIAFAHRDGPAGLRVFTGAATGAINNATPPLTARSPEVPRRVRISLGSPPTHGSRMQTLLNRAAWRRPNGA